MQCFFDKQVFKPSVSPYLRGYFLLGICLAFFSCKQKQQPAEIKIPKTIPAVYIKAGDEHLAKRKDTIYYRDRLFTGYLYSLYPSGDSSFTGSWFNGVEEGTHKKWYENGKLCEQRFYINGKKEGEQQGWWPDGKPKFSFTAVNDEYSGVFKEWYASGLLGKEFHYTGGHEDGSQRLWWENGNVRANYVIRNRKKYGLIGLKTCVNPYDSIYNK